MGLEVTHDVVGKLTDRHVNRARQLLEAGLAPACSVCGGPLAQDANLSVDLVGPGLRARFTHPGCGPSVMTRVTDIDETESADTVAVGGMLSQWPFAVAVLDFPFGVFVPMGGDVVPMMTLALSSRRFAVAAEYPPEHARFVDTVSCEVEGATLLVTPSDAGRGELYTGTINPPEGFHDALRQHGRMMLIVGQAIGWDRDDRPATMQRMSEAMGNSDVVVAIVPTSIDGSTPPPLPGRNEPCVCGSGAKFKRCHSG